MQEKGSVRWKCLIGGASKWKKGLTLQKEIHSSAGLIHLEADFIEKKADHFIILFRWNPPDSSFADILQFGGTIPLTPYIKRKAESSDSIRYQTIYAESAGSVAAPTAGLHFTESLFKKLQDKKIRSEFVTLHVGAGTFKPVKSETLADHEMHAEYMEVSRSLILEIARRPDQPIIAVGTTSLRTLESLYWMGIKIIRQPDLQPRSLNVLQWDPYEIPADDLPVSTALFALDDWMQRNQIPFLLAKTRLLIAPGYRFRIVRGLITNFHQPQSTLLLLIAAFIGDDWRKVYAYALEKGFRFLSYGDGCLLIGKEH
jgi:S-adenosylmethionine:tRNA ribosyltransferase-isomerase